MSCTKKEIEGMLISAFKNYGSEEAFERLVESYTPLVYALARKFQGRGIAYDELVQVGNVGLVKAIQRFDQNRGVLLSTFITPNVIGEIKRYFRDHGKTIRVNRGLRELQVKLLEAQAEFTARMHRDPTIQELVELIEMPFEEVAVALAAQTDTQTVSLDQSYSDDEEISFSNTVGREDPVFSQIECRMMLESMMAKLDERMRNILYQRFFLDMSQTEIAEIIGVSQMHVSRLIRRALWLMSEDATLKVLDVLDEKGAMSRDAIMNATGLNGGFDAAIIKLLKKGKIEIIRRGKYRGMDVFDLKK